MSHLHTLSITRYGFGVCLGLLLISTAHAQLSRHPDVVFQSGYEAVNAGPFTDADAARFLTQTTFGPTMADIQYLRQMGYIAWLNEQFNVDISTQIPYINWVASLPDGQNSVYQQQRLESWLINALETVDPSSPAVPHRDQLRQRMAFALSEIFVISDQNGTLAYNAWATASYYDMLTRDAFGNYRQLLENVTLHPAMATYLSMIGNHKPDPEANTRPDENYAREVMQLFSIGLVQLNIDGTQQLNNNQPIPAYDQSTVRSFAHVFTGWNFNGCTAETYDYCAPSNGYDLPWQQPMQAVEEFHDEQGPLSDVQGTYKQLLNYPGVALPGGRLAAGGTAQTDLTAALDNIFNHPNVGPFIGKQLIQRLVTSNPSSAYVQRVAQVFNDNGASVRGDLKAVVTAILFDPEARYGQWQYPDTFGKLREPIVKLTHLWRAMAARSNNGRFDLIVDPATTYGQAPLRSPSVFNFFRPNFQFPGEVRDSGLVSPEFQIITDSQIIAAPNDMHWRIFYFYTGSSYDYAQAPNSILMDESRDTTLAATPDQLIDYYNLIFMSGQMSPFMRQTLIERLNAMTVDTDDGDVNLHRVQQALYLIMTSPEYAVQK